MKYFINMNKKFEGIYLIDEKDTVEKNKRDYIKVECPCCHKKRYIRKTLLSNKNKQRPLSTICSSCSGRVEHFFYKENEKDIFSYTFIKDEKIYIDDCFIDILKFQKLELDKNKYVKIRVSHNKSIPLHRFIMGVSDKNILIDHINHNTLDNRKINLRIATKRENSINTKNNIKNRTGFKNISICDREKKWFCQFADDKNKKNTKRFKNFLDAYNYVYDNYYSKSEFSYLLLDDKTKVFRYAGVQPDDVVNGEGIGFTFYTQYCPHRCNSCHNPQTWDKNGGMIFDKNVFNNIINYFEQTPFADRLTLSGGDPLASLELSNLIASEFKRLYPEKKLWIYTGYTYEYLLSDIKYKPILELTDVLVDGKFEIDKRDTTLAFKGSSNQRIIDVQKSLREDKVILYIK